MDSNKAHNKQVLLNDIKTKVGRPVDVDVVVAIIESFGIRDNDAVEDYGAVDVYTLAIDIFLDLDSSNEELKNEQELKEIRDLKPSKENKLTKIVLFLKHYLFASSYLFAILLQLITIVVFGFALYVFTKFNAGQSTAVVLGIILGMILSGGFIHVIGKEISTYYYSEDFAMVKQITFYLLKKGVLFITASLIILFFLNSLFLFFPVKMMTITSLYAFGVGVLFLVFGPLHILKARFIIFLSTTVGTFIGIFLLTKTSLNIYLIHTIALMIAIMITLVFLIVYFWMIKKLKKSVKKKYNSGAIIYNNYHYFLYGILINLYFFIDRILAWSTKGVGNYFFPVFYEKDYEIGMDIAILFFLLLISSIEYSGVSFVKKLDRLQQTTTLTNETTYTNELKQLFFKSSILLSISGLVILFFVELFIFSKYGYNNFFEIPLNSLNITIAQLGIISYFFLCWGLLNALFLTTLHQQKRILRFTTIACIVNFITGFIASRFISYEYSVLGLLAGSITFAFLCFKENIKVFNNINYYYYASY